MESIFVVSLTQSSPDRQALLNFARTVKRLHWSSPKLTRLVHSMATEKAALARVELPKICVDIKQWVASGYRVIPTTTRHFLGRMDAIEAHRSANHKQIGEAIVRMLAAYERRSDRFLLRASGELFQTHAAKSELAMIEAILPMISEALDEAA